MFTRRRLLKASAAGGLSLMAGGLAAPAIAQGQRIRIGYVSPQSGPLSAFSEADQFVVEQFLQQTGDVFEVIVKDSQSNPNRASEVAQELIIDDEVHLMLVASTPETTNPVATVAEAEGVPIISTKAPWEPWFIGQQGNPADPSSWRPFEFAFHYFWGAADLTEVMVGMWNQIETTRVIGALYPNDADGNALGDPNTGLPPVFTERGFTVIDTGRYQNLSDDFTAQINAFKQANADIVTGVVIPPDFTTFFNQSAQQGFNPRIITVNKALLFPSSVETLGAPGNNLSCEVWWTPHHPFTSSLTGQSSAELAQAFTEATGRPWTQPIGFVHSLFEMAADVMGRVSDPEDREEVAAAIAGSNVNTIVGPVSWPGQGIPEFAAQNVTKTPLVGGQWRHQEDGTFSLEIVENATAPDIPKTSEMQPMSW
ncbi:ABC transporter substrate-binding protein [Rubellimicrobium rubrum]|uniref:ABC transporter substrate-binding protein n=1 Tax=Rubellimicrobium rubrum TaxID=2585369 RepID=A0A5C4MN56_9RHOB|nr:ABC transporter substrate-binding protein [Rubellimicrobium rubrum]